MRAGIRNAIIVVTIILLLALMMLSHNGRERVSAIESKLGSLLLPINRLFASISNYIDETTEPFFNMMNYKTLNENLAKENQALKEQIIELTMEAKDLQELKELKRALRFESARENKKYISASVIGKDPGNWFNFFVIDVGSVQGVTKNSTVINGQGLVGLVYEVGESWSKVIAVIDQRSSVAFEMSRVQNDFDGIVSGTKNYELIAEFYDPKAQIQDGDYLVTSGIGIYPRGILIGKIESIVVDEDLLLKRAKVLPVVDFKKVSKVLVLPYQEQP
ncbi:MAG: rod shape-determining protein MreC [Bacillota bacterium]|nr:rod shape-determining protein MreC [Bacillota bacterium]